MAPLAVVLRIDLGLLTAYQRGCLAWACVEQAAYRIQRGEASMSVDDDGIASIGGISFASHAPPRLGPAAAEAL